MVIVDQETCIGCGACVSISEKTFEMKDGKAHVIKGQEKSKDPSVKEAIDSCPVSAIKA
jgi:ferredoxin